MKNTLYALTVLIFVSLPVFTISAKDHPPKEKKLTVVVKVDEISKVAPKEDRDNKNKKLKKAPATNQIKKSGCCSSAGSCTQAQQKNCSESKKDGTKNSKKKH